MIRHSRAARFARTAVCAFAAIALILPSSVSAAGDVTPPVGSAEVWTWDNTTQLLEIRFAFSDAESGLDHIDFVCDGSPPYSVPYAAKVFLPMHDGTAGCSTAYGQHDLAAFVFNGDGLSSSLQYLPFANGPSMSLALSASPTTGHSMTISPVFPTDYSVPSGDLCRWEFRWGTTEALDETFTGDTFGGLLFDVRASSGGCGPWTFSLPWVPYRQFDVRVEVGHQESDGGVVFGPGAHARFTAAVGSTERRILSSNLPIAQVLPSTYTPITGQPITYTRYLVGGASGCCNSRWVARLGNGETPIQWTQSGGASFTFTPTGTGDLFVGWDRASASGLLLSGYFDPPVRHRDTTAPIATVRGQTVRAAVFGPTVPLTVDWSGSDRGWGVASYQLQKSVNGGAWSSVTLVTPSSRSASVNVAPGSTVRFRVRATDKAGNLGSWAYGSTFRVTTVSDADRSISYTPGAWRVASDATALGGSVHASSRVASATIRTSALSIAWVAERGPGRGKASVYVDGVLRATIDLGASSASRAVVFSVAWRTSGTHAVRILNAVTFHRPVVDVDGFVVLR